MDTATATRQVVVLPAESSARFERLHPASPLGLRRASCMPLQFPYLACQACANACPVQVLHREGDTLRVNDGCLHCGRCAAACPAGALRATGFTVHAPAHGAVYVDCWKVPREESPADAARVPCLGGLALSQWLALAVATGRRTVVALDRGWCRYCTAGSTGHHPAQAALDEAAALLAQTGVPRTSLPRIEPRPLPVQRMPRDIPEAETEVALSRRGFLADLARQASAAVVAYHEEITDDPPEARTARPGALAVPERSRRLEMLVLAARREGGALPASLFRRIALDGQCRNHGVCASLCPTGALARYEQEGARGLVFEAWNCIGCGACERACPEQALRLAPAAAVPAQPETLTRHQLRECLDCGAVFAAGENEERCPGCRKSRAAFVEFFGNRGKQF